MDTKKNLSDEKLTQLIQQGNMQYFSILATRYEGHIIKKCMSYVKDQDTAEDLCQEILIKLFLKIKDFHHKANFTTWLYAIIHNTCIDYLRRHKKNTHMIITEKMVDEVADMIDDVENLPKEMSTQILEHLLEEITPEEKLLLLLKYKERQPIKDIQLALNLSESAVKMRLKRAKEKVNKLYKKLQ